MVFNIDSGYIALCTKQRKIIAILEISIKLKRKTINNYIDEKTPNNN